MEPDCCLGPVNWEISRVGTTLGVKDSIECVRNDTFRSSLADFYNFKSSLAASTGVVVGSTICDNLTTGNRG